MPGTSTWSLWAKALAVALPLALGWRLSTLARGRQVARAQAKGALKLKRSRETQPASAVIGRLRQRNTQPVALRALSELLKARPRASKATVLWLQAGDNRRAPRSAMSFDRAEHLLLIEWAEGSTRAILTGEASVHHFASIGRINQFGASSDSKAVFVTPK